MRLTRKTTSDKEIIVSLLRRTKKEYYKNLDPQKVPDNRTFLRTVKPFLCNKSVENEKKQKHFGRKGRNSHKWWFCCKLRIISFVTLLRLVYTIKFFFHRWLNFSFDSFLSACEVWMKFFNLQSWKYFRSKNFYQIFDKKFFFWNPFHESKIKYLLKMT